VRVLDRDHCPDFDVLVANHVAVPDSRSSGAFVRLNMIASADGGSAVSGLSGGLGNGTDHAVFAALRAAADAVVVGMGTAVAEHYGPPRDGLQLYVIASRPDISGNPGLFESDRVTLVLPDDVGHAPDGVEVLRAGSDKTVDLAKLLGGLAGQVVMAEGGPTIAGRLAAAGLLDEFFLTVSPRVIGGGTARVVHGPDADPASWDLHHGFVDDDGYLFLRYARRPA